MIDKLFFIILVLNATGLFRFMAPQLGVSIVQVSIALLALNALYLFVKATYSIPLLLRGGIAGWLLVLVLWPALTVLYASSFESRDLGLILYSFSLFYGSAVYTVANGLPAMHRVLSVSLAVSILGLILSLLRPDYFEAVAALTSARSEIMGRAFGFSLEPNSLAIGIALLFTGWFSLYKHKNSALEVGFILIFLLLMLLCGSRTGMLLAAILVACITTYAWKQRLHSARYVLKTSLLIACLVIGMIGTSYYLSSVGNSANRRPGDLVDRMESMLRLKFNPEGKISADGSLRERAEAQELYWELIKEKPLLGHGLGAESHLLETGYFLRSTHSDALTRVLEYGAFYPVVFGLMMLQLYRKRSRRDVEQVFQTNSVFQFVFISLLLFVVSGDMLDIRTFYVVWGMFFAAVYYPSHVFSYDATTGKLKDYLGKKAFVARTAQGTVEALSGLKNSPE